jgi:hypothetical protein
LTRSVLPIYGSQNTNEFQAVVASLLAFGEGVATFFPPKIPAKDQEVRYSSHRSPLSAEIGGIISFVKDISLVFPPHCCYTDSGQKSVDRRDVLSRVLRDSPPNLSAEKKTSARDCRK